VDGEYFSPNLVQNLSQPLTASNVTEPTNCSTDGKVSQVASPVKVDQLDFFILHNDDVWSPKDPKHVALPMQDIQSLLDLIHQSQQNPLHLI
jgi:hypothetical protein